MGLFCERHKIPCLLPSTDLPRMEKGDFYTLYFSAGLKQEARLISNHAATQQITSVLQVYCSDPAVEAANTLASVMKSMKIEVDNYQFDCNELRISELAARIAANPKQATVLWLNKKQLAQIEKSIFPTTLYLSSTLLNRDVQTLSAPMAEQVFLAHPFRLPGDRDSAMRRFKVWAKLRHIEITYPRWQAEAFFASLTISNALKHMGRFFIRDFVLDMLDHAQGLAAYIPLYPEASFGPSQRFLAKGGYIIPLQDGKIQTQDAQWITP